MSRIAARRRVTRLTIGEPARVAPDSLAVEEPLEIRVHGRPLAITMRTPGHDFELASYSRDGLLWTKEMLLKPSNPNVVVRAE